MSSKLQSERKCKSCRKPFIPVRSLQQVCSWECARDKAEKDRLKKEAKEATMKRSELRKAKENIKTRAKWMREAQSVFNAYIRKRDEELPCISCGRFHNGQYHAGHFRTTAACPELRFTELNVWKQCAPCNNHKHGNITEYRINLIKRIGNEKVEWLEGTHEPKKYSIDDLKELKRIYKEKLKQFQQSE